LVTKSKFHEIRSAISHLFKPGQLIEHRMETTRGWRGFHCTDHDRMAQIIEKNDSDPRAINLFYIINPLVPSFFRQRSECKCEKCSGGGLIVNNPTDEQVEQIITGPAQHLCQNQDIETLQTLFIDLDTIRASHLKLVETSKAEFERLQHEASTDEEKAATLEVANRLKDFLGEKNWPQPFFGDSGNGYHVLPRINLQNTIYNAHLLLDCTKALANRFTCDACKIDASVFNPARLTRAYGSTNRKGSNTPERPHRQNRLFDPEGAVTEVPYELLVELSAEMPTDPNRRNRDGEMPERRDDFDPQAYFDWYEKHPRADGKIAFEIIGTRESGGVTYYITDTCLIAGHRHTGSDVTGFAVGKSFGYHCFSSDCEGVTLKDLHAKLEEEGFKVYPYSIFVDEGEEAILEMLEDGEIVDASEFDEQDVKAEKAEAKAQEEETDAAMSAPQPQPEAIEPEPELASQPQVTDDRPEWKKGSEALNSLDIHCNDLATHMLSVIFHHPTEVWQDGFVFFVKRLKNKLGFDKAWKKPEEGEAQQQTLKMPIGEALRLLVRFTEKQKRLPDKETFKHYLDVSTDPDVAENQYKSEIKKWVEGLEEKSASTFDITAEALIDNLDLRAEINAWRTSFEHFLLKKHDIAGGRTMLRKHFNISTTQDSNFEQGTWQERTDAIYADFEKNIRGVGDERKFVLGFPSIDKSGMNIGLDGDHAIVLCGPASNRKTTLALSIAMNFAIGGKNGLFFAGEHQCMKVLKRLTLQLSHFFKDDPEIGLIPGLSKWEGLNRTATQEDLDKVKNVLLRLKAGDNVPGFIEPQNINAVTRGEDDKLGALLQYTEATYPKYQWDFIIIDPLDTIMPTEVLGNTRGPSNWKLCSGIVDRLFDFSRNAFGGKGCMVIVTAQFGSEARREIEKIQEKNAGMESYDDELESILRRDGLIQYFTTIGQRFDLALGVATRTKDGADGFIVRGRDREGGLFNSCPFRVDEDTNYMTEKKREFKQLDAPVAHAAAATFGDGEDGL
jgi:hypothetical protein